MIHLRMESCLKKMSTPSFINECTFLLQIHQPYLFKALSFSLYMAFKEDYSRLPLEKYARHPGDESERSRICKDHGYNLIAKLRDHPRVILLGMTHPGGKIKQHENLLNMIKGMVIPRDIVAIEGARGIVDLQKTPRSSFAYRLMDDIHPECSVIHNEDERLVARAYRAQYELKTALSEDTAKAFFESTKARDEAMCLDPEFGLVNLARTIGPVNKVLQVTGMWHIWLKNIEMHLTREQIPYEVYVPREFVDKR